ncbi:MAG: PilZ domain-containing protein [Acidobacteriota bacterium]|nr:PilZ domain-containing protein [Acidobacteriota bacterium]
MADKRQYERILLPLEVRWEGLSGKNIARLNDLSLGGCYVESLAQVSIGESIRFEIQLPTGRWLELHGDVIYHQPTLGFGVHFTNLSELEEEMLASLVEYGKTS